MCSDINKVDTYEEVLKKASVVVDATGTNTTLLNAVIELNKSRIRSQKQIYIATSGILQFKETEDIVTERSELDRGVDLFNLQERNAADMLALTSEHIRGNIVRPGAVFGAGGASISIVTFATTNGCVFSFSERPYLMERKC